MKILHFALENYSQIPTMLVHEEIKAGHDSKLLILFDNKRAYKEGHITLNPPFVATNFVSFFKKVLAKHDRTITNKRRQLPENAPVWQPKNSIEKNLITLRDFIWEPKIRAILKKINVQSFDAIILDGGAGFLRNGKIIRELKADGKKIICCYYGSDFRTRGIIEPVDSIANAHFTFEYDHTLIRPEMQFLYFPFDAGPLQERTINKSNKIKIGHAPTNRAAKGSDQILSALENLKENHPIEIVLIENMPYPEAIRLKAGCDIFIDQIGELGYGVNSLESLALGIPTAVELMPDFEDFLGVHPFITIDAENIEKKLLPFIQSAELREKQAAQGIEWVRNIHNAATVSQKILQALIN
jgi:hypothetical protein